MSEPIPEFPQFKFWFVTGAEGFGKSDINEATVHLMTSFPGIKNPEGGKLCVRSAYIITGDNTRWKLMEFVNEFLIHAAEVSRGTTKSRLPQTPDE